MSTSAAQARAFYEQAAQDKRVFTFTADDDYLVFPIQGREVVPFWSSRSRLDKVRADHPKYASYSVTEIPLNEFLGAVLTQFGDEKISVGVNWSGPRLTGFDISPEDLQRNIGYWVNKLAEG
jgi:hypothetical protein